MINFDFKPASYFNGTGPNTLICKLSYPESQWGEEISIYANALDGLYYFEAVDFYGNDITLNPEKSPHELSLQELIFLIETMDVDPKTAQGNIQLTLSGIPLAESQLYRDLENYFLEKRKTFGMI
ncbi:UDP-glucuronosyltransferase [Belliella kenyensis]|uniref:UDP-glucuronosyltransferase n=1 Tax=Belliella kenyensis TaxID=1472724 RepID=A0ABV8ER41_9BACT|nr:UDP-glucuronosyltransferase [Belliella kenyensis]MCH7401544.1 UDP-glucuronosyltransferase [Belliella kenyensis]MDN3603176.1 UDP-glucuronosyltransferase [Belliella kenyensis]